MRRGREKQKGKGKGKGEMIRERGVEKGTARTEMERVYCTPTKTSSSRKDGVSHDQLMVRQAKFYPKERQASLNPLGYDSS